MITADQIKDYFIRINNRNNFIMKEIHNYHPESVAYLKYWKTHKKRVIEGFWSIDHKDINLQKDDYNNHNQIDELYSINYEYNNYWRYMPPQLYFYINLGTILHKHKDDPKTAPKRKMRPSLRDLDWEMSYYWLECRGFSGFSLDDEYSCNRDLLAFMNGEILSIDDKSVFKSNGELKKYIPARKYLRQLHDKPKGLPLYNNQALNLMLLGARELGKSFFCADGVILHEFVTDGAKVYNEDSIKNPFKTEIFVGAALSSKSGDLLDKVTDAHDNLPGAYNKGNYYVPSPFYKQTSGTLKPNNMSNAFRHEYEKKVGNDWLTFGTRSNIKHGIWTTENPEATAGTRPSVIVVEETGLLPNALQVHASNIPAQNLGTWKFGSSFYIGTGGNVDKIQESEILFKNPEGFNFLAIDDIFEGSGKIGFFVPAIYGPEEFKDENGNTNIELALDHFLRKREKARKSPHASSLNMEMMNYPLIPSEMFLNASGAMFPQALIKEHLAHVLANPHKYHDASYFGNMTFDSNGKVIWIPSDASDLVTAWPIVDNKAKKGIIQIWEMPVKDASGSVMKNRYIQGTDTYDDDESSTTSLGSTFIFDLYTDRIVAEFTGRPRSTEFYEITRMMNIYYAAEHNYENNKKGLFMWYDRKQSLHLLCNNPEYLKGQMDITIHKEGNKSKGTDANKQTVAHGLSSQLDWLLEPAYNQDEGVLNLHMIKSVGLLREYLNFTKDGNYDRISAMNMVAILRNQRIKFINKKQEEKVNKFLNSGFFERNYTKPKRKIF